MGELLRSLIKRFAEPSTHAGAGLVGMAVMFGAPVTTAQAVAQAVTAIAGALAIFVPEKAS